MGNLQGFGATIGCFLDDCMSSDKFVASEIESCAKVCVSLPECEYWVWGTEEGEQKCWFRTGDSGREAGEGWVWGKKACSPPGTQVMTMGNSECWAEGFGYPECCDAKYGLMATPNAGMAFTTTIGAASPRRSSKAL